MAKDAAIRNEGCYQETVQQTEWPCSNLHKAGFFMRHLSVTDTSV